MINLDLDARLKLLHLNTKVLHIKSSGEVEIEEKKEDGKAKVRCKLSNQSIVFKNADENVLPYLRDAKCADGIVFQMNNQNSWELKIIECKKTMTFKSFDKSIQQFRGAIFNALSLAGLLGISTIQHTKCYIAFREEQISDTRDKNPILLKEPERKKLLKQWDEFYLELDCLDNKVECGKIHLDGNGDGEVEI